MTKLNTIFLFLLIGGNLVLAQKPELIVPIGHTESVKYLTFSPNSKYLASGSKDNIIKIWEVSSGKLMKTLEHPRSVDDQVVFSSDGKLVITESRDRTARIWEVATGKVLHSLEHTNWITSLAFSPDGKLVVTSTEDTVKLWEVATGRLVNFLYVHKPGWKRNVNFSSDGKYLAIDSKNFMLILWEVATGKIQLSLEGHTDWITSVAFSPDGKLVVTGSHDHTAKVWEVATGKELYTLSGHTDVINSVTFSPDATFAVTGSRDKTAKIWEVATGNLINSLQEQNSHITSVSYSSNGKYLALGILNYTSKLWEVASGKLLNPLELEKQKNVIANFSPSGEYLASASYNGLFVGIIKLWEVSTGRVISILGGHTTIVNSSKFSPDGKYLAVGLDDYLVKIWEVTTGKLLSTFYRFSLESNSISFSSDSKYLMCPVAGTIKIWEVTTGEIVSDLKGHTAKVLSVSFSPDGKYLVSGSSDYTVKLWEVASGNLLNTLKGHTAKVLSVSFSPDGKYLVSGSSDYTVKLWEVASGNLLNTLEGHTDKSAIYFQVSFSPDGKYLASTSFDDTIKLWEVVSGRLLILESEDVESLSFSPDVQYLASGSGDKTIKLWEVTTGKLVNTLKGHTDYVSSVNFSPNEKYLASGSWDTTIKLWNVADGQEIATLINVDSSDWIVTTPSGLFDASPGAMELMHYTVGLEVIELNQLKDRYYEPGLLPKLMGYSDEPIRDVTAFDSVALYPEITLASAQDDHLHISLKNQGGGIGRVQIFINGKEIIADARGENVGSQDDSVSISYPIADHPFLQPGDNTIEVKAYNAEGWLVSRGVELVYQSDQEERAPPRLFLLSIGVSDYTGDQIDLKYAAKDAEDMAIAIELGAQRLFGTEKTFTHLLTSEQNNHLPTKENILATFEAIAQEAKSTDVFVAYLSGHGINWGGQDGDFYYLTQDAYTASTDAYNDPAIRESTTLSSAQLTELINTIPAQKQVLIIDACASGRVVENLMAQRDIPSSTIRALERMKDRTGMHIITGCAADAVSYEATRYGQGVLTYSLLEGIKGAALKEEKFVDVNTLFQYARERVPALASGIGGIQEPEVFSPYGAQSFDIGELTETDKGQIALSSAKPLFLRAAFFEQTTFDDVLGLEITVNEAFRALSTRGREAPLVFVEADEFPEAFRIRGRYTLKDEQVQLDANLFKGKEVLGTIQLIGNRSDLPAFTEQLILQARAIIE